jgi:hypothetical protein
MNPFSRTWREARAKFRERAAAAGLVVSAHAVSARGPDDDDLFIDVAHSQDIVGRDTVFVATSGVHGVEGFAGSALQIHMLSEPWWTPEIGVLLIHGINPFGMSHHRRVTRNNIDLNRNFVRGDGGTGTDALYPRLRHIVMPAASPSRGRLLLQLLLSALRYGEGKTKQALAGGQDHDAAGLFYAGVDPEEEVGVVRRIIIDHLSSARRIVALDIHTGLGPRGEDTLLCSHQRGDPEFVRLEKHLGFRVTPMNANDGAAYRVSGGLPHALPEWLPGARIDFITQELGTAKAVDTLHAMIAENVAWQAGERAPEHPARTQLLRAFHGVDDEVWQARVLDCGRRVARALPALLADGPL